MIANVTIDKQGTITSITFDNTTNWQYSYAQGISKLEIEDIINKDFTPYIKSFISEFTRDIQTQKPTCAPAKLGDNPVDATMRIELSKVCYPKYSGKKASEQNDGMSATTDEDVTFIVVEQMPQFPGGQNALFKFLSENVKYPLIARENKIQGRVVCQFVVNKDGSISDVEVTQSGGDASLDKEAVRVLKAMPNWIPGKQKGKPVRVKYTVPVTFRL